MDWTTLKCNHLTPYSAKRQPRSSKYENEILGAIQVKKFVGCCWLDFMSGAHFFSKLRMFRTSNFIETFHSNSTSSLDNYLSRNVNLMFKCHMLLFVCDMQFDDEVCGFVLFLTKNIKTRFLN